MSDSADYYSIYEGVWINWSRGRILGSTITLNRRDGGLLISFITLFITFVGTAFWRIICFALHYYFSSEAPRDALYHQQQAVLRNSANGGSGVLSLGRLLWAWRHYNVHRPYRRMLPTIMLAISFLGCFSVAGIFSSKIATSTGTEVLLSSPYCGIQNTSDLKSAIHLKLIYPYEVQRTVDSANYAQKCYTNTSNPEDCRVYVKKQLPWTSNQNATCPFAKDICKNFYNNIELDTGFVDSNDHLGINGPISSRVLFRSVMTCAPLAVDEYEAKISSRANGMEAQLTKFYLGQNLVPLPGLNSTFETWDYSVRNQTTYSAGFPDDYSINALMAAFVNDSIDFEYSNFDPIPQLRKPHADTHLYFLSANNITFTAETNDPWYSAHHELPMELIGGETGKMTVYRADDVASVLGCAVQSQICNPGLQAGKQCTPLGSPADTFYNAQALWPESSKSKIWKTIVGHVMSFTPIHQVQQLGISALTSRYNINLGVQGPLSDNQWQLDVEHWFKGELALLQALVVEYATGPKDPRIREFVIPPTDSAHQYVCKNQKILTTAYTNFNTFGLSLTFALGGIIIIISYTLEPFISYIQKRRYGLDKYSRLEWCTNETLQLQRLAHEELGVGTWHGGADAVPLTKPGEQLGMLDITDVEHPRLKAPPATMDELLVAETQTVAKGARVEEEEKESSTASVGDDSQGSTSSSPCTAGLNSR